MLLSLALIPAIPVSAQSPPTGTPGVAPQFLPMSCPFTLPAPEAEGASYRCGTVAVPIDYRDPAGEQLDLAVAILSATGPNVAVDPILWLEGGPGASALVVADTNRKITAQARETRDVILVDQRGSGYSGYLDCGGYQAAAAAQAAAEGTPLPEPLSPGADPEAVFAYASRTAAIGYAECRDGYAAEGIDLAKFRTETI